jgi:uncharacterized membrane protein YkvA (DUF1232 family)
MMQVPGPPKARPIVVQIKQLLRRVALGGQLLWDFARGHYREVGWKTVLYLVLAAVYFLSPIDLIPDVVPALGWLDDAGVIALVFSAVTGELEAYIRWRGLDRDQYFGPE